MGLVTYLVGSSRKRWQKINQQSWVTRTTPNQRKTSIPTSMEKEDSDGLASGLCGLCVGRTRCTFFFRQLMEDRGSVPGLVRPVEREDDFPRTDETALARHAELPGGGGCAREWVKSTWIPSALFRGRARSLGGIFERRAPIFHRKNGRSIQGPLFDGRLVAEEIDEKAAPPPQGT
ncbi:hypothetical protein PDE_06599 [Penicillium oxalicum 114-2]|uniref:Uncharacterized protein n=1 Tax=Penicillium oxalicum (strain 114-2 / CGMCC 5302) TaxID=933388 RepID=S8AYY7_PENO1|nr:hypothetical protein PDE_06599 [Penicillium oxalicum 114-2]